MFHIEYIKELLLLSILLSTISCTFIQKTKVFLPNSKTVIIYSFILNIGFGILFCMTFTDMDIIDSLWIGLFTFLGANSIYKTLEGRLSSYTEVRNNRLSKK